MSTNMPSMSITRTRKRITSGSSSTFSTGRRSHGAGRHLAANRGVMRAEVYPISDVPHGRLAIMPRPRAGDWLEDEIASWKRAGLDVIVSLLEDGEIRELDLLKEAAMCERAGLLFLRLPLPDRGLPPSTQAVSHLVCSLAEHLKE